MKKTEQKFDVVVIGGGPSGMIAAGRAAELGARVGLLEKNSSLGRKLLMTGKGRCNLTQDQRDPQKFIEKLGKNGKFLFSALNFFGVEKTLTFFEMKNLKTKVERGGRIFPMSGGAQDVLRTLETYLKKNQVSILTDRKVLSFESEGNQIRSVRTKEEEIVADNFILTTGGKSYPGTGSTGDGYAWAKSLGHTINRVRPALTPLNIREEWVKRLQGLSLKNVEINVFQNGKKQDSRFGELLFTHFGLSGPIILDASQKIGELLEKGEVKIALDLKPALSFPELDNRLKRDFETFSKKDFKNYLPELLPEKMVDIFLESTGIDPKKKINSITKEERRLIVHLLKSAELTVESLVGFTQAIITAGGVATREVDPKTMRSKKVANLFLAGEILDLNGPTGGYNLQICWSTGYVAGTNAGKSLSKKSKTFQAI
ncbi:MAG: NAD(P)/FAD-dependent oxidoreductase [Patescibacteria group bacterium]